MLQAVLRILIIEVRSTETPGKKGFLSRLRESNPEKVRKTREIALSLNIMDFQEIKASKTTQYVCKFIARSLFCSIPHQETRNNRYFLLIVSIFSSDLVNLSVITTKNPVCNVLPDEVKTHTN